MKIKDKVQAMAGDYKGYYGEILAINGDMATVTHSETFGGLQIPMVDLELQDAE